jgi:hypothetical protein
MNGELIPRTSCETEYATEVSARLHPNAPR